MSEAANIIQDFMTNSGFNDLNVSNYSRRLCMLIFALFYHSLIGSNKKMLQAGWLYIDICMDSGDNNFQVLVVRASARASSQ